MNERDKFIDKWANHLSGKFARFAYKEASGPGLDDRIRAMVREIEKAVGQIYDDAQQTKPTANGAPASPTIPMRKATS